MSLQWEIYDSLNQPDLLGNYAVVNVDDKYEQGNVYTVYVDPRDSSMEAECMNAFGWTPTHYCWLEPLPYRKEDYKV